MSREKIKSEWYLLSALSFVVFSSLIISLLFKQGEARTFGQLVAIAVGGIVGVSDWWKSKPPPVHFLVAVGLVVIVCLIILYKQNIKTIQNLTQKLKRSIFKQNIYEKSF